ncbi:MAG: hydroxypyruvate isomerase, partial [Hyphomicrobiales bacterium]|nr:hydroxypyruvate isomerase [Hyphomicrobiales bacterium]
MSPKFSANLSMLFTELAFLDRFEAAARAGFGGVEYVGPYEFPAAEIAGRLRANGLIQA